MRIEPHGALRASLLAMGATTTAAQILIIRELLIVFHGNELFFGVIFGVWLVLEATGSYSARRAPNHTSPSRFIALQLCLGFAPLISLFVIRSFRALLGLPIGELLGLEYVLAVSLIALAPVALTDGALFPLGCRNLARYRHQELAASRTYLYEALGSFLAGVIVTLFLIHYLTSIQLATILLIVNSATAFVYLGSLHLVEPRRMLVLLLSALIVFSFLGVNAKTIDTLTTRLLWDGHTVVESTNSPYANIAVLQEKNQLSFFSNGVPYATMPEPDPFVEEIAHFPMLFHPKPQRALILGGGVGGLLNEALKHPVERIDVAEHDPTVFDLFRRYPTPLTDYELNHPIVQIHAVDGRQFLRSTLSQYDVIIVNLPIPSTLQLNRYYTKEFFTLVRNHLTLSGVFSIHLPGSETFLTPEVTGLNRTIYSTLSTVFPAVRIIVGERNIYLASTDSVILTLNAERLSLRLLKRRIQTSLVNDWYLDYKTNTERFGTLERSLMVSLPSSVNEDDTPVAAVRSIALLGRLSSPFFVSWLRHAEYIGLPVYLLAIFLAGAVVWFMRGWKGGSLVIDIAVASTGFVSMLCTIVLILSFQIHFGYVYQYIGLLTSLFMLGSALGVWFAEKKPLTKLLSAELLVVALTLALLLLWRLEGDGVVQQALVFCLMWCTGLVTGMEFPLAFRRRSMIANEFGVNAGTLYSLDLIGAFVGAILTGVALMPLLGATQTMVIALVVKTVSAVLVAISVRD